MRKKGMDRQNTRKKEGCWRDDVEVSEEVQMQQQRRVSQMVWRRSQHKRSRCVWLLSGLLFLCVFIGNVHVCVSGGAGGRGGLPLSGAVWGLGGLTMGWRVGCIKLPYSELSAVTEPRGWSFRSFH